MPNDQELTEDEVADLKEAFAMFDINGDGKSLQ
jgi:Ca2+-binding EF-hand superfamily protein